MTTSDEYAHSTPQHGSEQHNREERGGHSAHGGHAEHGGHSGQGGHSEHGGQGEHRSHKFDPARVERLLSEDRQRLLQPEATLRSLGVAAGQTIVDVGCGPGLFTVPAARLVGNNGRVYGLDISPEMVEACQARLAEAGLPQGEVLLSGESKLPLEDGVADGVLIAFVLHETDEPIAFFSEVRRILKPGGWVAVLEWLKDGPQGPPPAHRLSAEEVGQWAAPAHLHLADTQTKSEAHYLVRLRA